ncbi:hypothetical protein Pmar_PMAR000132 [Perkinsus marinus ATCC 50983]|uniref:Uncharacterized protein n=1 Tax=Perkinsus marinus (strain ATCC 50983 / TXsc) TaxID=423536 RepID=C5KPZ8_PERM5|nr:hypothetical protein Pmar_PMAR000132 [Perkinsus marinus ATCC 50983]EER13545.1 hypothetical protein Pmar_PMAR000132 [Perkinsus marinus ATCC 50983]|eukprot:XP_002781750.1 hypothetical protein Pmar_PMAR000132 [Perkinsus marinus ATCC 50983]
MSGFLEEHPKLKVAKNRLSKLTSNGRWLGGHIVWTAVVSAIVLAVPVFFEYERECQFFDQMNQLQQAQMNECGEWRLLTFWSMLGGQRWVDERMREADLSMDENDVDDNSGDMPN